MYHSKARAAKASVLVAATVCPVPESDSLTDFPGPEGDCLTVFPVP